jgi:tRNA (mo5U34)-methyltransferase
MSLAESILQKRRQNPVRLDLEQTGLYHSFRLPDGRLLRGAMSIEWQEERLASFGLPERLDGKRLLDIGPWDGYFTFEVERRGADVTAIDYVDLDTFRELHRLFASRARYESLDVYELDPTRNGVFDIVLCLGVLYHLKHPLLALERICAVTREFCIVETFVVDGETWQQGLRPPLPFIEFYERAELGGQLDNWSGPTVGAVEALVRAAGFARADVVRVTGASACVVAHRKWKDLPPDEESPVELFGLSCHRHRGRCFESNKEEYIALWCIWSTVDGPPLETVFPEVDGFGVAPISCTLTENGLLVSLRVPPGLSSGKHEARIKIGKAGWSHPRQFFLDLPPISNEIDLVSVQDGITWQEGEVDWARDGWMTLWVNGLSPEADAGNTVVEVAGVPHLPETVSVELGQVNVRLRPVIRAGTQSVRVLHRGAQSRPINVTVVGQASWPVFPKNLMPALPSSPDSSDSQ